MAKFSKPDLSIVLPVYNGEQFIGANLDRLLEFLKSTSLSYEVIVVDDGSTDRTPEIVRTLVKNNLKLFSHEVNRGKYAALVTGMSRASGRCRVFTDADLPFELESLTYLYQLVVDRQFHIVVGDRTLPESVYLQKLGLLRKLSSRAFAFSIRMLVTGGLFDPQCGLKAFRDDVAEALFPLLQETGFSGDVELLYIALKYNLEIKRIPVRFTGSSSSTVSLLFHSLPMLLRVLRLPHRWASGVYRSKLLGEIARQDYWNVSNAELYKRAV